VRRALRPAAAALALLTSACLAVRSAPIDVEPFAALARASDAVHARPAPSAVLWVSQKAFAAEAPDEELGDEERGHALALARATRWFSDVRLGGQGDPAELLLEAHYQVEDENRMDLLQLPGFLTLGLIPNRRSTLIVLDLRVSDASGRVRGEVTEAERYSLWQGWIFLPLMPVLHELT